MSDNPPEYNASFYLFGGSMRELDGDVVVATAGVGFQSLGFVHEHKEYSIPRTLHITIQRRPNSHAFGAYLFSYARLRTYSTSA